MSQTLALQLMSAKADSPITADDLLGLTAVSTDDVFTRMKRVDDDYDFDALTNEDAEEMTDRYRDYQVGYDPYTGSVSYADDLEADDLGDFVSITDVNAYASDEDREEAFFLELLGEFVMDDIGAADVATEL